MRSEAGGGNSENIKMSKKCYRIDKKTGEKHIHL